MSNPHGSAPVIDDEPKTPMWLPALGAALFLAVAVAWAVCPGEPAAAAVEAPEHVEPAPRAAANPPVQAAPPAPTMAVAPGAVPGGSFHLAPAAGSGAPIRPAFTAGPLRRRPAAPGSAPSPQ